jgi:hypothetical protein
VVLLFSSCGWSEQEYGGVVCAGSGIGQTAGTGERRAEPVEADRLDACYASKTKLRDAGSNILG